MVCCGNVGWWGKWLDAPGFSALAGRRGHLFNVAIIVIWFVRRPGTCVQCDARLSRTSGFCQVCGGSAPGSPQALRPKISPRLTERRRYQLVAIFALFVVASLGLVTVLPLSSGLQMGVGFGLVLVAYVAILLVLRNAATCPACSEITDGKYCAKCGYQLR